MVSQGSIDLIRKYIINRDGNATKSEVAKYMQYDVPQNLRLSRDTVMKIIENMDNIIIKEGERRGQGHRLLIEDKGQFTLINDKLLRIENFMNDIYEKFLTQFNQDLSERPAGAVSGLEEAVKFISFIEYSFHGIVLFVLQDIFKNIISEKDRQVLYNRVIQLMLRLSHLSQKERAKFFSKQIEQLEKYIQSPDFELIYYHYGISNKSLEELISIMENLKLSPLKSKGLE
jgi:hypothetical protein